MRRGLRFVIVRLSGLSALTFSAAWAFGSPTITGALSGGIVQELLPHPTIRIGSTENLYNRLAPYYLKR